MKLFVLAESKPGYLYDVIVYCGREGNNCDDKNDIENNGKKRKKNNISEKIVLQLVERLSGKGRKLYVDNWYTSANLFLKLMNEMKTNACGTVKTSRKYMPKLQTKKMKTSDIKWYRTSKLFFTAWKDKRVVTMLSTMNKPEIVTTEKKCYKTNEFKRKPNVVKDYNDNMGGVDLGDQMI